MLFFLHFTSPSHKSSLMGLQIKEIGVLMKHMIFKI